MTPGFDLWPFCTIITFDDPWFLFRQFLYTPLHKNYSPFTSQCKCIQMNFKGFRKTVYWTTPKGWDHNFTMFFSNLIFKGSSDPLPPSSILNEKTRSRRQLCRNCYMCFSVLNWPEPPPSYPKKLSLKKTLWNNDPIPKHRKMVHLVKRSEHNTRNVAHFCLTTWQYNAARNDVSQLIELR